MATAPEDAADKVDIVLDQMVDLTRLVNKVIEASKQGPTQTVIHKTAGMGPWGAAAVVACFATWLGLILFGVWTYFQVNNLWAWKDVHAAKIAVMEAKQK